MTTPVAMPVIVVLMQFYPGGNSAVPAPRQGNAAVMSTYYTLGDCDRDRVSRGNPQDFFCLEYRSEQIIPYVFPADKQLQGSLEGVAVGPLALKEADKPFIEPLVEPKPLDIAPKQAEQAPKPAPAPGPKRVAERPRTHQQAMFESNSGNPLHAIAGLFNNNDNW